MMLPGRRIIDVDVLVSNLVCEECSELLHLKNITDETICGFSSIFYILCSCGRINRVATGKQVVETDCKRGSKTFEINIKAAAALLHCGIGLDKLIDILKIMNIPCLHKRHLKKRERTVGPVIESLAKKRCLESNSVIRQSDSSGVRYSYDMGWQRRSSGRNYNSMSGHGSIFANGSLVAFGVRTTTCRICEVAAKNKKSPPIHDCRRNWDGSSKAMEADVAVELFKNLKDNNSLVKNIIMDDDTTTIHHLRSEISHGLVKLSDTNHSKKILPQCYIN